MIVVGAGVSGLLTALALSKEKKSVLLVEKEKTIGGLCKSYKIKDYTIDTGPHIITRLNKGSFRVFINKYFDVVPEFVEHGKYYLRFNDHAAIFPWTVKEWLTFSDIPKKDRLKIVQAMIDLLFELINGKDLSVKSIGDVLNKYSFSKRSKNIANAVSFFIAGTSMNECPIERIVNAGKDNSTKMTNTKKVLKLLTKKGAKEHGYPKGGLQSIINCITESLPENCEIKKECEVKKIITENNCVKGVTTSNGNFYSNTIVFTGQVSLLPELLSLSDEYSKEFKKIKQAATFTLWLGLNKKYFKNKGSEIVVELEKPCWIVPVSNYDASLAPEGKQLVGFGFVLSPEEQKLNNKILEEKHLNLISNIFPEIKKDIDLIHSQIQYTETIAINQKHPSQKTPINGLYLAGKETNASTSGASIGVSKVAYTVLKCLNFMKKDGFL